METGDRKLNEVKKVTDMAYVPVIMADGSIGQIAKSDLASVVAGLTIGHFRYLGDKLQSSDTKECGYGYTDGANDEWSESGMFLNITNSSKTYGWQIRANLSGTTRRVRNLFNGEWGDWFSL